MTPEYLEELAQRADPDDLWKLAGIDQLDLPPEKRKQLDTAVALRRYARHLRDVDNAAKDGKSWLVTRLGPSSTAVRAVKTPPDHQRSRDLRNAAPGEVLRTWQHDETGRITETAECPGPRWAEVPHGVGEVGRG